jgi:hypothetical protein
MDLLRLLEKRPKPSKKLSYKFGSLLKKLLQARNRKSYFEERGHGIDRPRYGLSKREEKEEP